jgi:hypothetical protein
MATAEAISWVPRITANGDGLLRNADRNAWVIVLAGLRQIPGGSDREVRRGNVRYQFFASYPLYRLIYNESGSRGQGRRPARYALAAMRRGDCAFRQIKGPKQSAGAPGAHGSRKMRDDFTGSKPWRSIMAASRISIKNCPPGRSVPAWRNLVHPPDSARISPSTTSLNPTAVLKSKNDEEAHKCREKSDHVHIPG